MESFFSNKNEAAKENNLKRFLEKFPEQEFWRFFVKEFCLATLKKEGSVPNPPY